VFAEDVEGLAGTDPEDNRAGGDETIAIGINDGEFAGSESEVDDLGGVGGEVNALETHQGAEGSPFGGGMGDVELDDIVTGEGAGVGDASGDEDGGVAREGGRWMGLEGVGRRLWGRVLRVSRLRR